MAKVDNPYPICNYNIFIVEFIVRYVISSMSCIPHSHYLTGGSFEKLVICQMNNMAVHCDKINNFVIKKSASLKEA